MSEQAIKKRDRQALSEHAYKIPRQPAGMTYDMTIVVLILHIFFPSVIVANFMDNYSVVHQINLNLHPLKSLSLTGTGRGLPLSSVLTLSQ